MPDFVQGKDVIIYVLVGGVYRQIACYTDCSLITDHEVLETTSKTLNAAIVQSGRWRQYRHTVNTWQMTCSGIIVMDSPLRFDDMRKFGIDRVPVLVMFNATPISGMRPSTWSGYALVIHTEASGGVSGAAPWSLTLQGNGELQVDFEPINLDAPLEQWFYYKATGNEGFSFTMPELIGYMPVGRIGRGGYWYEPSGTMTTARPATDPPGLYQYRWDSNTGTGYFSPDYAPLAPDELIQLPMTKVYSGCSLSISGFSVTVNSDNRFYLQWTGTGIPANQLTFEASIDGGNTFTLASVTVDPNTLDNAVSNDNLDTSIDYLWRITPYCSNGQAGAPSLAGWTHQGSGGGGGSTINYELLPIYTGTPPAAKQVRMGCYLQGNNSQLQAMPFTSSITVNVVSTLPDGTDQTTVPYTVTFTQGQQIVNIVTFAGGERRIVSAVLVSASPDNDGSNYIITQ